MCLRASSLSPSCLWVKFSFISCAPELLTISSNLHELGKPGDQSVPGMGVLLVVDGHPMWLYLAAELEDDTVTNLV